MRDFRDAKVMAQTLRDALRDKGISITHSDSLELIAKILGLPDWNVLAATIQSERNQLRPSDRGDVGKPVRQEITVDAKILDAYVGFYLLSEAVVMAVTREGPQLLVQLTGQNPVPVYAQSDTEFFAKAVDAQISFVIDAGKVESLILHQHGHEVVLKRIDAAAAKEIDKRITERLKSQSPSPGTEAALRHLIEGIISGVPDYGDMTPVVAEATRQQLPKLESDIGQSGPVQTIRFLGVGNKGEDVYLVTHERRPWNWRIALDSAGKIWMVWLSPGL